MTSSQFDTLMRRIDEFDGKVTDRFDKVEDRLDSLEQSRAHEQGRREQRRESENATRAKLGLVLTALGLVSGWVGSHIRI